MRLRGFASFDRPPHILFRFIIIDCGQVRATAVAAYFMSSAQRHLRPLDEAGSFFLLRHGFGFQEPLGLLADWRFFRSFSPQYHSILEGECAVAIFRLSPFCLFSGCLRFFVTGRFSGLASCVLRLFPYVFHCHCP